MAFRANSFEPLQLLNHGIESLDGHGTLRRLVRQRRADGL